jgi:hypothetical protein
MASRGTESTICVSSANRDLQAYPNSSDFLCELKQRFDCQAISLSSLELPLSQYLIEDEWSLFDFDVGLSLPSQGARTLYVTQPYTRALLALPAPCTPVVYGGLQPDGRALWTVAPAVQPVNAHGLVPASLSALPDARVYYDPAQPPLRVLAVPGHDAVASEALPLPGALAFPAGGAGVLFCGEAGARTFANPAHLCVALNAFFADPQVDLPLRFDYDASTATLGLLAATTGAAPPVVSVADAPQNLLRSLCLPPPRGRHLESCRVRFPPALTCRVPEGNYDYGVLRQQLEVLCNPLLQFGSVPSSTVGVHLFGAAPGSSVSVTLGAFTLYDPKAVALALSQQMELGLGDAASVRFDFVDDAFEIFSSTPFRIFWGASGTLGAQLGFDADLRLGRRHRGCARHYLQLPTAVSLPAVHEGESLGHLRRLAFAARGRVQAALAGGLTAQPSIDGARLLAPVGALPCEYLAAFPRPAGDFLWAVASHVSAGFMPPAPAPLPAWFTVLEPLVLPLPPDLTAASTLHGTVLPFFGGACNLYLCATPPAVAPRLAEILGCRPGATLWPWPAREIAPLLLPPHQVCLEGPTYVLLDLCIDHLSTGLYHRVGADSKTSLFAKLPLYGSSFKWESRLPASKAATGSCVVTQFRVRLLTPWHSLWQLHGRNWSCTVTLASPNRRVGTECP